MEYFLCTKGNSQDYRLLDSHAHTWKCKTTGEEPIAAIFGLSDSHSSTTYAILCKQNLFSC